MPDPTDDLFGMPPLDLGETMGPQAPPPSAPSARARAKEYAPLLALLPIIARSGGRVGIAALLNGFQQARAQSQQTARQAQMDAERQRQIQEQERYRRDTLAQTTANNEATRRQQTLVAFQNGLKDLDSTEAADAYVRFWEPQLRAAGIRPNALNSLMSSQFGMTPQAQGLVERGNVDLYAQPVVPNPDGTSSTVDSFSVNIDGREVLLPTVTPDGRHLSQEDAIAEYEQTGRHLGVFDSPQSATAYASQLHRDYESGKYRTRPVNRFQKKEAESIIEQAKKQYGDQAVNNTYTLRDGTHANWEELNRRAGVTLGATKPEEPDLSKSSLDVQAAAALARGDTETYNRLKRVADEMSGARRADPSTTGGGSDARTAARIDRVAAKFDSHPIVKEYNELQAQRGFIRNVVNGQWSGPGDMSVIFAFMKALDPNSVVRETEYANAARSGNIFAGWAARFNGALSPNGGFLSDRVRRDFLRQIEERFKIKGSQYQNLRRQMVAKVDRINAGVAETGDEAIFDYEAGVTDTEPTQDTSGAPARVRPSARSSGPGPVGAPGPNPFRR